MFHQCLVAATFLKGSAWQHDQRAEENDQICLESVESIIDSGNIWNSSFILAKQRLMFQSDIGGHICIDLAERKQWEKRQRHHLDGQ